MKRKLAFTLTEILIVVVIIGLISAIGIPLSMNAIQRSKDRTRENNISSVEAAKEQWALENNKTTGTPVQWSNISNYMGSSSTSFTNLDVDGVSININNIGTRASY